MGSTATETDRGDTAFFGHPRGLSTLFFTEMWERFSFYGMKAFLLYYMVRSSDVGGLGMSDVNAAIIFGIYTSSVYLMSVPGGWIADRFLGLRNAVFYGGILIMCGHIVLALPIASGLYLGLLLIVLGTGLLKPNISAVVGQLYDAADKRRDAGYSIYYMGINLGATIAPLVCGFLAESDSFRGWLGSIGIDPNASWHIAFAAAAVGMFFGLVQFTLGTRNLKGAGERPARATDPVVHARNVKILVAVLGAVGGLIGLLFGLIAAGVLANREEVELFFGGVLVTISVVLFGGLYIKGCENVDERRRLIVIFVLFLGSTMFWACFEQVATVLALFTQDYTSTSIAGWDYPPSWLQSVNGFFIILLAPVFAALWLGLARRNSNPSSPAKFGASLVLVGLGFALLLIPSMAIDGDPEHIMGKADPERVSVLWLVGVYFVHTCAELCLSPVGLSSMSKLAPARWGGLVMGIWFMASANGNFLAAFAVKYSSTMALTPFFTMMIFFPVALALVFFLLVKPIGRMLARSQG